METITGIEIFPLISFVIFFVFFIGLFFWVFAIKKEEIQFLSALPLEEEEKQNPLSN